MSGQFPKAEVYKELVQQIFCHDTRHTCREKNKIASSKLCRDMIKVGHDRIQDKAQKTCHDRKLHVLQKQAIMTKNSIVTKLFMS